MDDGDAGAQDSTLMGINIKLSLTSRAGVPRLNCPSENETMDRQNNDICARDNSRNGEIAHYARNKKKKRENFKIFSESDTNAVNGDLYRVRVGGSRG